MAVRKNPHLVRGPQPGTNRSRVQPDEDCPDCPQTTRQFSPLSTETKASLEVFTVPGQAEYLWKHIAVGTGTCVSMIETYVREALPGDPRKYLVGLRDRLDAIINKYDEEEQLRHESLATQERSTSAGLGDGEDTEGTGSEHLRSDPLPH